MRTHYQETEPRADKAATGQEQVPLEDMDLASHPGSSSQWCVTSAKGPSPLSSASTDTMKILTPTQGVAGVICDNERTMQMSPEHPCTHVVPEVLAGSRDQHRRLCLMELPSY